MDYVFFCMECNSTGKVINSPLIVTLENLGIPACPVCGITEGVGRRFMWMKLTPETRMVTAFRTEPEGALKTDIRVLGPPSGPPRGQLNSNAQGAIQIAVGIENDTVVMHFGSAVEWIGFDPAGALAIGKMLSDKGQILQVKEAAGEEKQ